MPLAAGIVDGRSHPFQLPGNEQGEADGAGGENEKHHQHADDFARELACVGQLSLVLSVMKPANLSAPLTNCIELASRIGENRPPFYTAGEKRAWRARAGDDGVTSVQAASFSTWACFS